MQNVFKVTEANGWDVSDLASSEVRIIILYCTQSEASLILESAAKVGLTSHKYLWLVTQSVIGDPGDKSINRRALPVGMMGKGCPDTMSPQKHPLTKMSPAKMSPRPKCPQAKYPQAKCPQAKCPL